MERDKKGRFVKKANTGTELEINPITTNFKKFNYSNILKNPKYKLEINDINKDISLDDISLNASLGLNNNYSGLSRTPNKLKYYFNEKGIAVDQTGKEIPIHELNKYEYDSNLGINILGNNNSAGVNEVYGNHPIRDFIGNTLSKPIDKEKLANFLELSKYGTAASINKKMAERSLEVEKPFLQDVSDSHRSIYGDYRSQMLGEQSAALLRNMASIPLTSDGALLQQMMMDAQIKGQEFINQGNAQDEALIKQTREVAWQQEKENLQQRQAVAMQNKQAMLMSEKNKAQIENTRDSAMQSMVIDPLLSSREQRLRNEAVEQQANQDYYYEKMIPREVLNTIELTDPKQNALRNLWVNLGYEEVLEAIAAGTYTQTEFDLLSRLINDEILKRQMDYKGVSLNTPPSDQYARWRGGDYSKLKAGGTIYKAKLVKRTRDNDRAAKSIESSKKIAARFLEKALDSLYTYKEVELIAKPKKKRKYLSGGGIPFVGATPVFATSERGATQLKKKEESEENDLTTKDILELLKDMDGLPADMQLIIQSLKNFLMRDRMDPLGLNSSSNLASQYMNIINKIKVAKFNREEYNNAFNLLKGNGGLNELAVTSNGYLIGTNENGDFEYFTPDLINSEEHSKQGYLLLTNSNLLYLRANSLEAAFNHNLTTVAQNGIGMEVITKQINDILSNLGSSKESEEGFIKMGSKGQIKEGLKYLQKAAQEIGDSSITDNMSVADYYLAGYLTEDLANQAQLALNYIWSALPTNAQSLLQVKGKSIEGAENIIKSLVYSKTSTESQFKATPKKMSKTSSSSSGSDDIDKLKLSPVLMMQTGYTDHLQVTLQKGTKYATVVNAQVLPITDVNKKLLGVTTLDLVAESTFGGALDMNNVTMGSQLIDPHALQNVQIDSTNLYVMNLPIDKNSLDGTIKPDLSWMSKIEEIDKIIREQKITDINKINLLYEEAGLPILINANGELNTKDYCKFGVLNGHALNTAFKDLDLLDNTVVEIDDEDLINNILSILNKGRGEKNRIDFDSESLLDSIFGTKHNSMFEGTIYIPIRTNAFTGMIGGGQYPTTETAEEVEALIQQKERTQGYIDPGLLI